MARLDDEAAVADILAPILDGPKLLELLNRREPGLASVYDAQARTARYLVSDVETVMCFSVTDVTREEASSIYAECRTMSDWSGTEFHAAAGRALGGSFERLQ